MVDGRDDQARDSGPHDQRREEPEVDPRRAQPLIQCDEPRQQHGASDDFERRTESVEYFCPNRVTVEAVTDPRAEFDAEQHPHPVGTRPHQQQGDIHAVQGPNDAPPIREREAIQCNHSDHVDRAVGEDRFGSPPHGTKHAGNPAVDRRSFGHYRTASRAVYCRNPEFAGFSQ